MCFGYDRGILTMDQLSSQAYIGLAVTIGRNSGTPQHVGYVSYTTFTHGRPLSD